MFLIGLGIAIIFVVFAVLNERRVGVEVMTKEEVIKNIDKIASKINDLIVVAKDLLNELRDIDSILVDDLPGEADQIDNDEN